MMLPAPELPGDVHNIWMLTLQGLSHQKAPVEMFILLIELIGIAALHLHRSDFLAQESIEKNRAIASFENAQAEISIFVVSPSPAHGQRIINQGAGIDPGIEQEGLFDAAGNSCICQKVI